MLTKKSLFSVRAPPSKLVYFGTQGTFRKILGLVDQKWISQNSSKGDPLGRQGVKSLREDTSAPSAPLNALVTMVIFDSSFS